MPTTEEVADVLAKVQTRLTAKIAMDAAQIIAIQASDVSNNTRNLWASSLASGDEAALETLLTEVIDSAVEASQKAELAQTASNTYNTANTALDNKLYELITEAQTP